MTQSLSNLERTKNLSESLVSLVIRVTDMTAVFQWTKLDLSMGPFLIREGE